MAVVLRPSDERLAVSTELEYEMVVERLEAMVVEGLL
jgi:hypothetical protein